MGLHSTLDRIHTGAIQNPWLKLFAATLRPLLAAGFILPGLKKVADIPFAPGIPTTEPIGYFFDAFFQATEYYIFVGLIQTLAGILLLFPATVALGSVLYLPVILNIFIITIAMNFTGTWAVAGLMLLANIFLLCWEFDKWNALIPGFDIAPKKVPERNFGFFPTLAIGVITGVFGIGFLYVIFQLLISREHLLLPSFVAIVLLAAAALLLLKFREEQFDS